MSGLMTMQKRRWVVAGGLFLMTPGIAVAQLPELVICLTQVAPICSVRARGGFSPESGRVRRGVRLRGGVLGVIGSAPLA